MTSAALRAHREATRDACVPSMIPGYRRASHTCRLHGWRRVSYRPLASRFLGMGYAYNFLNTIQPSEARDENNGEARLTDERVFGATIDAEVGITGYEYSAGVKLGKSLSRARSTHLITVFAGRSGNWIDLKPNTSRIVRYELAVATLDLPPGPSLHR